MLVFFFFFCVVLWPRGFFSCFVLCVVLMLCLMDPSSIVITVLGMRELIALLVFRLCTVCHGLFTISLRFIVRL